MTSIFFRLTSPRARAQFQIIRDADHLIRQWGTTAFDRATDLSSREDLGFIDTGRPGHWWSVRDEIGRRTGRRDVETPVGAPVHAA